LAEADVRYTFERDVYMYERHTYSQMTYKLPVRTGFNTIILKFAEMYFDSNNKRVFDVMLGKKIVFKDLDIHSEVGKLSADDKYIEVEIDKGRCLYKGENIPGALQDGKLVLQFVKGKADNPIVQGIIVYNAPLSCTLYPLTQNPTTTNTLTFVLNGFNINKCNVPVKNSKRRVISS
jgi:hypothetical protein